LLLPEDAAKLLSSGGMTTSNDKLSSHVWLPRLIVVIAWAMAIFTLGVPLCKGTFWLNGHLPQIEVLAWFLAVISFILRRSILAGSLVFAGLAVFVTHWL